MHTLAKLFAVSAVIVGLSGCVVAVGNDNSDENWDKTKKTQVNNQSFINQLQTGATLASVRNSLGSPDFTENFQKNNETIEVLFYRTHRTHGDGMTTKDECTALIFKQGLLVAWGDKAYQQL
ncbi:MAG: DUF3192 domain-containing protein [Gammaproteobacteria bacterium]|jgi:hypothetical protein|nr:DUF3192 domain-containing protein [Gammaproteobacteria bacterium]MBU2181042.1 DUF3192 domain-containing protein [Gammaproteobacteria bacterium]MBU2222445.1 DUF3192 domain-containing protein [Gammaproteobacteria bacterium]MBU2277978.1 DUF3192 domain-containing protein [Gammaproteobacteria bacterium]MBU2426452.1 DUF3192 domain-containing protein [Gammaproteobacteria bacterium]